MLGDYVEITLDAPSKKVDHPLRRGFILKDSVGQPQQIFAIGFPRDEYRSMGTVIAVVNKGRRDETCIVAPKGWVYYEPQLSAALEKEDGKKKHRMTCLYEKSCGAVVYMRRGRELRFLLVKNRNGRNWGFPKGHIEQGETEEQTAIREIFEETGLQITVIDGFRETTLYRPFGRTRKQVVFFLARSSQSRVRLQRTEIDHFYWATYYEARGMIHYENDVRILTAARQRAMEWEQMKRRA